MASTDSSVRLPRAKPKELGLDASRLKAAEDFLAKGLEAGEYTAATYLVARHGKIAASGAMGRLGLEEDSPPARIDTIFDMASVTKPVATATSLMILVERGALHLNQPVTVFFPDRNLPHLAGITVRQLATHTSGLPAWCDLFSDNGTRSKAIENLFNIPLENQPGTKHVYSCMSYIMLGLVIEQVAGMSLSRFARENIFQPLGMTDSGHNPPKGKLRRVALTGNSRARERNLPGDVHDENAHSLEGNAGNAGLFSTAPDIAIYAQALLNGGEFGSVRILSPLSAKKMLTNRIDPSIGGQSIGYFTEPNGFPGTSLLIDPEYDMFVILLTNRVLKNREGADFIKRRKIFHNVVASAAR
jgi:CubicO group peptidase (beta-lactamase class C family)